MTNRLSSFSGKAKSLHASIACSRPIMVDLEASINFTLSVFIASIIVRYR